MVQHQAAIVVRNGPRQLRLEGEARRIVDDLGAVLEGPFRHFRLVGIHGDWNSQLVFEAFQNRNEPAEFFGGRNTGRSGPRGFGSYIHNIRALLFELERVRISAIGIGVLAAIGKGIRA